MRWWFKRRCSHEFYLDDITRVNEDLVTGRCHKCEKVFKAPYGLALPGIIGGRRQLATLDSP